jgi:hypothetical protein
LLISPEPITGQDGRQVWTLGKSGEEVPIFSSVKDAHNIAFDKCWICEENLVNAQQA